MAKTATAKKPAKPAQDMPPPPWAHGTFHWNELRDARRASAPRSSIGESIGWTFERTATPDGADYWLAMESGKPVAGFFQLSGSQIRLRARKLDVVPRGR